MRLVETYLPPIEFNAMPHKKQVQNPGKAASNIVLEVLTAFVRCWLKKINPAFAGFKKHYFAVVVVVKSSRAVVLLLSVAVDVRIVLSSLVVSVKSSTELSVAVVVISVPLVPQAVKPTVAKIESAISPIHIFLIIHLPFVLLCFYFV